ncbi:glycosyltransferase family 58 protein [Serpula lacrymans var. lacrymans S7.3]|uniref:Dol-P-Man:Man(5)GlcNAc(2)-PP-Dol alpha-1,3-mannosyltransferase n=2 Tax=Serpula lacrymans var. lacrymans TaxID=341189 RepID=F8Q739_SERL3|nr:glycosyltransferase family 58 protein [Serpula lacrymans var. lacrymans S7.3]
MSVLLFLPGLLVVLFKRCGLTATLYHLFIIASTQVLMAFPFLRENPWSYLHCAFDLSRVFLYKWTVNWRIVDEETFLSPKWAKGLLVGHVSTLIAFGLSRWCRGDGGVWSVLRKGFRRPSAPAGLAPISQNFVATTLFTSNLIGILFARSLHYQFYAWYAQQLPYLTFRTRYPVILKLAILLAIEYAWNIFPSTPRSSGLLLLGNALLLLGIGFGHADGTLPAYQMKSGPQVKSASAANMQ